MLRLVTRRQRLAWTFGVAIAVALLNAAGSPPLAPIVVTAGLAVAAVWTLHPRR